MPPKLIAVLTVLARVMLAAIFLGSGVNKIVNTEQTIGAMTANGVPLPAVLVWPAILFLIVGGVSVVLGWQTRIGTGLLMLFLALATYYFHDFWTLDPKSDEFMPSMIGFQKNVGLLGGLLFLFANGPGPASVDNRERLIIPGQVEPLTPESV